MSMSTLTLENAPRDPHELEKAGRFNLRRLAENLGLFKDEETKAKILGANNLGMAEVICAHLASMDQGGNGKPAQAPAATQATVIPIERTPRNGTSGPAKPAIQEPQASKPSGDTSEAIQILSNISNKIDNVLMTLDKIIGLHVENSTSQAAIQQMLTSVIHSASGNQALVMSALAIIAAEKLECSPAEFVHMAIQDVKEVEKAIGEAKGKA